MFISESIGVFLFGSVVIYDLFNLCFAVIYILLKADMLAECELCK